MENKHTLTDLYQMQALPLSAKIRMTKYRIRQWIEEYGEDGVYVSFSGGKDSTVLLHLVREDYPNVPAMFVDVPTQYTELRDFVKTFDNVDIVKPKMSFMEVCRKYGFPLISKEVSESVYGAKRYLTSILNSGMTDRQPYKYYYEKVTGTGKYSKFPFSPSNADIIEKAHMEAIRRGKDTNISTKYHTCLEQIDNVAIKNPTRGGYDRKYRRVRGIGEFSKQENEKQGRRKQSKTCNNAWNAIKKQGQSDKGEYP